MIKIRILSVGKNKESWLDDALGEYVKRLKAKANIEFLWAKDDKQLVEWANRESLYICLDPKGIALTSEQFASFMQTKLEEGGSRLTWIIGGPEGLPAQLREHKLLLSLSTMTLTHQLTRLILLEQIYRAFEILKGTKYHK